MMEFRGDHAVRRELVERSAVKAILRSVVHSDARREECSGFVWQCKSVYYMYKRSFINVIKSLLAPEHRKVLRVVYFVVLAVLMWAPLNGFGISLDNFVLGIRFDHLLHATVYVPCAMLLFDVERLKGVRCWVMSLAIAVVTESVQYLLPYRGFDINDMVANFIGVTLGFVIAVVWHKKHLKISP